MPSGFRVPAGVRTSIQWSSIQPSTMMCLMVATVGVSPHAEPGGLGSLRPQLAESRHSPE